MSRCPFLRFVAIIRDAFVTVFRYGPRILINLIRIHVTRRHPGDRNT